MALLVGAAVALSGLVVTPAGAQDPPAPTATAAPLAASDPGDASTPAFVGAPYFAPGRPYAANFPDPSIVYDPASDRYHAFATTTGGVNVPTMWSTDGRTWTARSAHGVANPGGQLHDALPWPLPAGWPYSTGDPNFVADLWAPGVGRVGNRWAMFYSLRKDVSGRRCLVYATSDRPDGPYANPRELHCSGDPMGSVDPQPFTDPATGTTYLVWTDSGWPGRHGQRIWARPIGLADPTTVSFTGQATFLLESAPGWEQYVAENPSLTRLPDGTLALLYSGNQWVSDGYATGAAVCSGLAPSIFARCTRTSAEPFANRRVGRAGVGGMTVVRGRADELVAVSHSWAEGLPAGYNTSVPSNQRRMTTERLHQVEGRLVLSSEPGPSGAASPPAAYLPRTPQRVLDTRWALGSAARRLEAGEVVVVDLAHLVAPTTTAVTLNVTVTEPVRGGFVTAFPCGAAPNASNVNHTGGQTIPDLVTVRVNPQRRICLYSLAPTHLVVDLQGTYDSSASGGHRGVGPTRLLDTRGQRRLVGGEVRRVKVAGTAAVPSGATAVTVNLTAVGAAGPGFLTAWDCAGPPPVVSNVNYAGPAPEPNAAIVPLSPGGDMCVYSHAAADVVVDVFGHAWGDGASFAGRSPVRLTDTRWRGTPVGAGQTLVVPVVGAGKAPTGTTSVVITLTATEARAPGWVSAFPCAAPPAPGAETSNLNLLAGETRAVHATVPVGPDGAICLRTLQTTHLLVDLAGSFA